MTPSEARQAYLEDAIRYMRPLFEHVGKPLPEQLRVSIGWSSLGKRALGACYSAEASSDQHREIFISPVTRETWDILGVLAHELCHSALPFGTGHKKPFIALGHALGLEGKPTHLNTGPMFKALMIRFYKQHGDYPAGSLVNARTEKQPTAMRKCECSECGYIARTTLKWIDAVGAPHCPDHGQMEVCG